MVSTMKMVDTKTGASRAGSTSGVRVNRTGRRTYTLDYKREIVRQCLKPGVSVAAVALAHGINANLVRRWIVGHQRASRVSASKLQATLLAAPQRRRPGAASIEIELYGARIHLRGGVDVQSLRSVLAVLAQR
ncbi:MAG: transposase [Proteobacteria bacterium]|nr:transposase [Pseudomonadota bacterium]